MIELPVQDGRRGEVTGVLDLDAKAAAAQTQLLGALEDRSSVDAVAAGADAGADLVQLNDAPEVAQRHGQAGGAAVGRLQLSHEWHAPAAPGQPLERGERTRIHRAHSILGRTHHSSFSPGSSMPSRDSVAISTSTNPLMPSM